MNTQSRRNFLITTCTVAAAGAVAKDARMSAAFAQTGSATGAMQMAKISEFGRYEGYSEALFDGTRRTSDYLTLSNGTRLAYDLILPTKNGVACDRPLPVLFKYTPYLRTFTIFDENGKDIISPLYQMPWVQRAYLRLRYWLSPGGRLIDPVFRDPWLGRMLRHGYAVVVVERPGTGASFGRLDPSFEAGARESDEIMNWIAAQAWSNGNIGMFGDSWQGQIQLQAASTGNPHLKAIFPVSTWIDQYNAIIYPGGVYAKAFGQFLTWSLVFLDSKIVTPVDTDRDGILLAKARQERSAAGVGKWVGQIIADSPFRDSVDSSSGQSPWSDANMPYAHFDRINRANVPMYLMTGWYDIVPRDMLLLYANTTVPKRLTVRPSDHSQTSKSGFDLDFAAEAHRWFDHWLKRIDNGIMGEPPIHYYVMGAKNKPGWQSGGAWPPEPRNFLRFYFGPDLTGASEGALVTEAPTVDEGYAQQTANYAASTGKKSRWTAVNWSHEYPNMRTNDAKAATFTTRPLTTAIEVLGHPVLHALLSSDAADLDMFAYLEDVDSEGNSTYVTEGNLRASHRATGEAPYKNFGLPYHRHFQSEITPMMPGEPVELVFDLLPTAYRFEAGQCIRVAIAFSDADNFDTPIIAPAPTARVHRDRARRSMIELPVE